VPISPTNGRPGCGHRDRRHSNSATGAVSGTLGFTDPNNDTLSYATTTSPSNGAVSVDSAGGYTYTPTAAARAAAGAPGAPISATQDAFTVTANDAHGGTTGETVTVPISPSNPNNIVTIRTGAISNFVAVSPDGSRLYVDNRSTRCR